VAKAVVERVAKRVLVPVEQDRAAETAAELAAREARQAPQRAA
jgi:hypothetical protein